MAKCGALISQIRSPEPYEVSSKMISSDLRASAEWTLRCLRILAVRWILGNYTDRVLFLFYPDL